MLQFHVEPLHPWGDLGLGASGIDPIRLDEQAARRTGGSPSPRGPGPEAGTSLPLETLAAWQSEPVSRETGSISLADAPPVR